MPVRASRSCRGLRNDSPPARTATIARMAPTPSTPLPAAPGPAIVLTSGGLDSTTCLAIARAAGHRPLHSLAFDYGQRHRHELAAAKRVADHFGVAGHRVITIDLRQFGRSALTADIAVPRD